MVSQLKLFCSLYDGPLLSSYPARTCARGKAIGCVRLSSVCLVSTKITRSEDSGILMVGKHDHIVGSGEKLSCFCFLMVDTCHEHYKLCDCVNHTYQGHVLIQLHMLELNVGEDCQVVKCMSDADQCYYATMAAELECVGYVL